MKRSPPPARRTPLRAKTPTANGGAPRARANAAAGQPHRKRIKHRSDKRAEAADAERDVRLAVFARDGHRCVLEGVDGWGACAGPLQFGHLRKAGQGGRYVESNAISQCALHNGEIENRPAEAHRLGLVVRAGETVESAWERMRAAGLVPPSRHPER